MYSTPSSLNPSISRVVAFQNAYHFGPEGLRTMRRGPALLRPGAVGGDVQVALGRFVDRLDRFAFDVLEVLVWSSLGLR
jgi:hypothetical protein